MARPRKSQHRNLPRNLTFDICNKIYRYRDIVTGKQFSLGGSRQIAIDTALALNERLMKNIDLVSIVLKKKEELEKQPLEKIAMSEFIENRFFAYWLPRKKKPLHAKTLSDYKNKAVHIKAKLGNNFIDEITVKDINDFLNHFPDTNSNRYRSLLSSIFKYAMGEGITKENPAIVTIKKEVKKARQRMKYEEFKTIHQKAGELGYLWMQNAMDIALLTLQRQNDILKMRFDDIIAEEQKEKTVKFVKVVQEKTKDHGEAAYIKIKIGEELQKVLFRCRDQIASPLLIHRKPEKIYKSANRVHFTQILQRFFIDVFSEVRDASKVYDHLKKEERPTFHEIRSLGIKMYEDEGIDAQKLAGHTTRAMTDEYKKGHEIMWTYAEAR